MRITKCVVMCLMLSGLMTGCTYLGTQVDLGQAAKNTGMRNITTGDGTFADYTATDHQRAMEIGFAVGIPFIGKLIELYPVQDNQAQVEAIANQSKTKGANAMINVEPPHEFYTGFPFLIVGLYVDTVSGTGINVK